MNKLDDYVKNYDYRNTVMYDATKYCTEIFLRYMHPVQGGGQTYVLELGPAEGISTELLAPHFDNYTAVDGSEIFCKDLQQRLPAIEIHNCYFEEFSPTVKYNYIVLGHVLEHVDDPSAILKLCRSWLAEDGLILSAVPNAHSLHRQAAVMMGLLEKENALNDTDRGIGHQRVYNYSELKQEFTSAGLHIKASGGYWIKPISNGQIEATWTKEMIRAFLRMGEDYPDIAAEIYVVAGI